MPASRPENLGVKRIVDRGAAAIVLVVVLVLE